MKKWYFGERNYRTLCDSAPQKQKGTFRGAFLKMVPLKRMCARFALRIFR